jgi:hypothetical protein
MDELKTTEMPLFEDFQKLNENFEKKSFQRIEKFNKKLKTVKLEIPKISLSQNDKYCDMIFNIINTYAKDEYKKLTGISQEVRVLIGLIGQLVTKEVEFNELFKTDKITLDNLNLLNAEIETKYDAYVLQAKLSNGTDISWIKTLLFQ